MTASAQTNQPTRGGNVVHVQPAALQLGSPTLQLDSPALQLDSPTLELPTRHYRWLPVLFSAGAVTSIVGTIGYYASGFCDGPSCEGRDSNELFLIPAFGGLALFTGGLIGFIVNKIRYGRALRLQPDPLVVAW